jgi:tetratricopeptide (TPR) repeat protein
LVGPRLAQAALLAGQPGFATEVISKIQVLAREATSSYLGAKLQYLRAEALTQQSVWAQAQQDYAQAIRQLEAQDSRLELGHALLSLGRAQADHGDQARARVSLQRAQQIFEECGAVRWKDRAGQAISALDKAPPSEAGTSS